MSRRRPRFHRELQELRDLPAGLARVEAGVNQRLGEEESGQMLCKRQGDISGGMVAG